MCDGKCATTLFKHAGKCPNLNFGKCLLENVLNSSVEKVRHCRTNSTPKKQHIWHFPGSGFLVGNSPSLLNGVGNLPSTVIYYWKMFDSHKQYRWDFLAAGKCQALFFECMISKFSNFFYCKIRYLEVKHTLPIKWWLSGGLNLTLK